MVARAETSGLKQAFCLLIVFGSNPDYAQFTGDIAIDDWSLSLSNRAVL